MSKQLHKGFEDRLSKKEFFKMPSGSIAHPPLRAYSGYISNTCFGILDADALSPHSTVELIES